MMVMMVKYTIVETGAAEVKYPGWKDFVVIMDREDNHPVYGYTICKSASRYLFKIIQLIIR
jgi:hypothetical protein